MMGTTATSLNGINSVAMRSGNQLTMEQRTSLNSLVKAKEIEQALKDIRDLKVPALDGYGLLFFKSAWNIVMKDFIVVVMKFFVKSRIHKPINATLVTLIPKIPDVKTIRDYRHIPYYTII